MPLLHTGKDPLKVACRSCIDGHRSPTCFHLDRILVQVRQPGRPRVHCTHGAPSWGSTRCKTCYPTIAYIIPGGQAHMKKCGCHDKSVPIRGWKQTTTEVAEAHLQSRDKHLSDRRRAEGKGSNNKRKSTSEPQAVSSAPAAKSEPQTPAAEPSASCCSKTPATADATDSANALQDDALLQRETDASTNEAAFSRSLSLTLPGDYSCGYTPNFLLDDCKNLGRRTVTPLFPGQSSSEAIDLTNKQCDCGDEPGDCTCIGCPRHPDNNETHAYVEDAFRADQAGSGMLTPMTDQGFTFNGAFDNRAPNFQTYNAGGNQMDIGAAEGHGPAFQPYTHDSLAQESLACANCDCGPECRCANCPCHPQQTETSSSGQMHGMSSETATSGSLDHQMGSSEFDMHSRAGTSLDYMQFQPPPTAAASSMDPNNDSHLFGLQDFKNSNSPVQNFIDNMSHFVDTPAASAQAQMLQTPFYGSEMDLPPSMQTLSLSNPWTPQPNVPQGHHPGTALQQGYSDVYQPAYTRPQLSREHSFDPSQAGPSSEA